MLKNLKRLQQISFKLCKWNYVGCKKQASITPSALTHVYSIGMSIWRGLHIHGHGFHHISTRFMNEII